MYAPPLSLDPPFFNEIVYGMNGLWQNSQNIAQKIKINKNKIGIYDVY